MVEGYDYCVITVRLVSLEGAMSRKLKVFGGLTHGGGYGRPSVRTLVATTSQKEAARLVQVSLYEFQGCWCETENEQELEAALAKPGVVIVRRQRVETYFEVKGA